MSSTVVRYSDAELEEFRQIILTKYEKSKEQLSSLQEQIIEITENTSDEHGGDWVDDSSINNEVEMLNNMAIRQRMYIKELENALIRIKNKSYGICTITGKLIDKKRLLAVPTTTKSLEGKANEPGRKQESDGPKRRPARGKKKAGAPKERKVITKVIRKPTSPSTRPIIDDDEDDDDLVFDDKDVYYGDDDEDEDNLTESMDNLDDFADGDGDSGDDEEVNF